MLNCVAIPFKETVFSFCLHNSRNYFWCNSAPILIQNTSRVYRQQFTKFHCTRMNKNLTSMASSDWFTTPPCWTPSQKSLLLSEEPTHVPPISLSNILEKSSKFLRKFPISSICCHQLKRKFSSKTLERNINSAYPLIHEHALHLCSIFLLHQKRDNVAFYKNMTLLQLVNRLLRKRAISFVGVSDHWILLDGSEGLGEWERIGTANQQPPLLLENCLSYDEIKLSALLSVSSYTYFINDGNRQNSGFFEENREKIEETGVIIGLIGARLEKENVMEYREIIKSNKQNTEELGYGKDSLQSKFLEFYGDTNTTYQALTYQSQPEKYVDLGGGTYFDIQMFERRITLSIDTLLIEANSRAKEENSKAYIHVVGLGLGVWKIWSGQSKIFMDTFSKRLEFLYHKLPHVSDICFAYMRHNMAGVYKDGDCVGHIRLHMRNRNPHDKLKGTDAGKLLVVSYAWDGNAFPGNEFWYGSLTGSGDPAAACSTQIAELHNFYINGKVCGPNLKVATLEHGIVTYQEYQQLHLLSN